MTAVQQNTSPVVAHADASPNIKTATTAHCGLSACGHDATETSRDRDSYAVTSFADIIDRSLHATAARFTMGLSPAALAEAYLDWATHLAFSPGKRLQLVDKAARKAVRFANYACRCAMEGGQGRVLHRAAAAGPSASSARSGRNGRTTSCYQAFLLNQQWWHNATTGIRGVTKQHENMVEFASRQMLDMFSPSNFPADQSRGPAADDQQGRHESGERLPEFDRGLGARRQRQETGRHRELRRRPRRGGRRPARWSIAIG